MKPTALLSIFLFFLLSAPCPAADSVSVTLSVDRTEASLDDAIQMVVHVSGVRNSDAPPVIRGLDTFQVAQGGTSSRVEIINGAYRSGIDFTFFLTPSRAGTFRIGPAEVRIDGKVYKSDTRKIHVKQPNEKEEGQPKTIFLSAALSKDRVFAEEQTIYTLRLYLRRQATNISLQLPEPENIVFTQLEKPREYEGMHDGLRYRIIEIPYALMPGREGRYAIDAARMSMTVNEPGRRSGRGFFDDSFFGGGLLSAGRPLSVSSNSLELQVEPLPVQGRPEGFTGLVGDFTLRAGLEPRGPAGLKVGESATLTVTVEGRGNIHRIPDMQMPEMEDIKVYADEPVLTPETDAFGIRGSKTMKWALVPEKEGDFTIPSLTIPFFDSKNGQYRILETAPFRLTVLPGKKTPSKEILLGETVKSSLAPVKQDVKEIGHDILPLHDSIQSLGISPASRGIWRQRIFPLLILILPAFLVGFVLFFLKIKKRSIRFASVQRAKKAAGKAIRSCRLEGSDPHCLILTIRDYFNERFGLEMASITADDVVSLLTARGTPSDAALRLSSLVKQLESAVYTGKDRVKESIGAEIAACIKRIEKTRGAKIKIPGSGFLSILLLTQLLLFSLACAPSAFCFQPSSALAEENRPEEIFFRAIQAQKEGHFEKAVEAYRHLIDSGYAGGHILYNLGNAHIRLNELGMAILAYERARRWIPRDADLQFNLAYARNLTVDAIPADPGWVGQTLFWIDSFTLKELFHAFALLNLLFCTALLIRLFYRPEWLFYVFIFFLAGWFLAGLSFGVKWHQITYDDRAVILKKELTVLAGPHAGDTVLFKLHEGAMVREERREDEWMLIHLPDGKRGWIPAGDAARINEQAIERKDQGP